MTIPVGQNLRVRLPTAGAQENGREPGPLKIEFNGGTAARHLDGDRAGMTLPLSWLAGEHSETIWECVSPLGESHGFRLFSSPEVLIGCALEPVAGPVESTALGLYRRLLAVAQEMHLYRVWHYLPEINRIRDGVENYRAFNAGRSRAFEEALGGGFSRSLSAASTVGCDGGDIALVFIAGNGKPRHCENPEQIPAYRYPPEHGVRSPSFARATVVGIGGRKLIHISGTSAIKGHATIAAGSTIEQLECTLDNLRLISMESGAGEDLGAALGMERRFKVYLRNAADLHAVKRRIEQSFFRPHDRVAWLQADLCRAELNIEIEATLSGRAPQPVR
jgi:chorismate lyase / 3-hydroxybenzoate synthase